MPKTIITGRVLTGEGLGRATGYPTANLAPELIAKHGLEHGVYAAWASIDDGEKLPAIVIIGTPYQSRPSVVKLEVYFINFNKDIRGTMITAELVEKIRPVLIFDDLPTLLKRIEKDIEKAKIILGRLDG